MDFGDNDERLAFVQASSLWGPQHWQAFGGCSLTEAILQTSKLIWETLPIAIIIALFSGALLVIQTAMSLKNLGGGIMGASVIGYGGVREVFPLLAGGAVATRAGAALASEMADETRSTTRCVGHYGS